MEMDIINKEDECPGEKVEDGKQLPKANIKEEKEDHYSSLMRPQEDLYAEAFQGIKSKGKETEVKKGENTIVYKTMCLILSSLCLILLLVVIVLATKQQLRAGPEPACRKNDPTSDPSTCTLQTCEMLYNTPPKEHACQHCDEDWLSFDGSCYFLSTFRLSWDESREKCISMGGSLATIKSPKVQAFLTNTSDLMFWIGLNQSNRRWTWVDNTELQKSYWGHESQTGDCVYLHAAAHPEKNWIKNQCHLYSYFICQM